MDDIPHELKKKIADAYIKKKKELEDLNPDTLEAFASELLEMIDKEKLPPSHDLQVLKESMTHLKKDATLLNNSKPESDDYDFARNDCNNLITATRKWLELEGII